MFRLDGNLSFESKLARALLTSSDLPIDESEGGLCCTIYRQDPVDSYLFLLAHAGLREPEPMYGPKVYDDERKRLAEKETGAFWKARASQWNFPSREATKWYVVFKPDQSELKWAVYLSGRGERDSTTLARFRQQVLPPLELMLDETTAGSGPLYPELLFAGRSAQNRLNRRYAEAGLTPDAETLASLFADAIREELRKCGPTSGPVQDKVRVGVYIPKDDGRWRLKGGSPQGYFEPTVSDRGFAWVHRSTRPVLVSSNGASEVWRKRLQGNGSKLGDLCSYGSLGLVPILDPWDATRCFGILVLAGEEPGTVCPGFLYLGSRLSLTLSRHLAPAEPVIRRDAQKEVFFSYCEKDTDEVREVAAMLRGSGKISPWLYNDQTDSGGEIVPDRIENAIKRSRVAAVFLGNHGLESWRKQEVDYLKVRRAQGDCVIMPVVLGNCEKKTAELQEEIGFLATGELVDLRQKEGFEKLEQSLLKEFSSL